MSAIITGKIFWTTFTDLAYKNKNDKEVKVKETTAKIVMLAIGDSADDYGENSWQSFETIARKSSIQRRSVVRVVRALIAHGYLKVAGITNYGTNNFSVNTDKLGSPPKKRARVGRPVTSDSDTEIGDSVAIIGDPESEIGDLESSDPSLIHAKTSYKSNRAEAKERTAKQRAAKGDPLDLLVNTHPNTLAREQMRIRVETATGLKLVREWDNTRSPWNGYDKELVAREAETGQTIEQFMTWFNSEEFRRENQRIWLDPAKIEKWWNEAFKYAQPQSTSKQPQQWQLEDWRNAAVVE